MNIFYPIQLLADYITFNLLKQTQGTQAASVLNFFIFDSIKILTLLFVIIFLVTFIRSYFPPERIRKILHSKYEIVGNVLAALFGIITPFCSCSAIPLFVGMIESRVPLGVTLSYLISAPMVNEVVAIMLFGLFGIKITAIYMVSGVLMAIIIGFILGKMNLGHLLVKNINRTKVQDLDYGKMDFKSRARYSLKYTTELINNIFLYVLLGIGIGSFIHGYAPENILSQYAGLENPFAVPVATIIGVPLYSSAAAIVPIVKSLIDKGLPLGTALSFMMAVTALSLPEMIILRRVMKLKLLTIYVLIITVGIIFTGYFFNSILSDETALFKKTQYAKQLKDEVIKEQDQKAQKIEIIQFYKTSRCYQCLTLERQIRLTLNTHFEKEVDDGKIIYTMISLDQDKNNEAIKKYGALESALFIETDYGNRKNSKQDLKVWTYATNDSEFVQYFTALIKSLL